MANAKIIGKVLAAVAAHGGLDEHEIAAATGARKFDVYIVLATLANAGDSRLVRRVPQSGEVLYFTPANAPKCHHERTHRAIGTIDPTEICSVCGSWRKWSSAEWSK